MPLSAEQRAEVLRLHHAEKWKAGTIARHLGLHHRVVRRVLGGTPPVERERPKMTDRFAPLVRDWLSRHPGLCSTRVADMLRERGFTGSERTVRRLVTSLRPRPVENFLEVETLPGEQAQVDWAETGRIDVDGARRKLFMFVMTLSHSRALYVEFVLDLGAVTLCRSLCRAVGYFGGCTRTWLFDNTRAVVLDRVPGAARFNAQLLAVACALRVEPRLCAPYQPRDKGKVERVIRYLRDRFLAARSFTSLADANAQALRFIREVADAREHPRQRGRTVREVFEAERGHLLALPAVMPETEESVHARVDRFGHVRLRTNRYSVPPGHVGRLVELRVDEEKVRVLDGAHVLATHALHHGRNATVEDPVHRAALIEQRTAAREHKGRDRLLHAAPGARKLLQLLLDEHHNMGLCTAQMLRLLDDHGAPIFAAAVQRVLDGGVPGMPALRHACEQLRREAMPHMPVAPTFAPHVRDKLVQQMDLGDYDDND
mgnify:CR=1 FL=1|jgi:transposase